jgi:hypothetical protein
MKVSPRARSATTGAKVYGFVASNQPVTVTVASSSSVTAASASMQYAAAATVAPWVNTSGCMPMQQQNGTMAGCSDPGTPKPPEHGEFTWVVQLQPQATAGGE